MQQSNQNNSKLPIILTRKPRHRISTSQWELEFTLEETCRKLSVEKELAGLAILGTALEQIGRNRKELTRKSWIRFRLRGLEDFLRELNRLAIICLGFDKSITVSRLVVRALHDFILAVDGTLSGQHVIVFESMRDVMEIELLIREFQNGPQRIQEWAQSDNATLKKKFAPGVLRQIHANRLGVKPQDLPEHSDYQAHSVGVHVTPFGEIPPFGSRDMITDCSDPFAVDACFWEIFNHSHSLLLRLREFLGSSSPDLEKNTRLRAFIRGRTEIKKSQDLYYGILEAISRQLQKKVPSDEDITIELDVVPEDYRELFLSLCDGRRFRARVFFENTLSSLP